MNLSNRIPIDIVTGFLGAGKTSLLRRLIAGEAAGVTAVLVNEFGEIGLDQHMFEPIAPDVMLLQSGCVCCQIRGEVKDAVVSLIERRAAGEIPPFRKIVLETSGLSEPAPLLSTFVADPILAQRVSIRRTITVVDVLATAGASARPPEWVAQAAAADGLALSKLDLADPGQECAVRQALARLNPTATIFRADAADAAATIDGIGGGVIARPTRLDDRPPRHDEVDAAWFRQDGPLDWPTLSVWLSAMLHVHGEKVLRMKGLIDVGADAPLLLNGVQHIMHRPEHLPTWPDGDRSSRIVFITRGIPAKDIVDAMARFLANDA